MNPNTSPEYHRWRSQFDTAPLLRQNEANPYRRHFIIDGLDERPQPRPKRASSDSLYIRAFKAYLVERRAASARRHRCRRIGQRLIWGIAITLVLILLLEAATLSAIAIEILLTH